MSTTTPPPNGPGPEFLEPAGGEPFKPPRERRGGSRRTALIAGGAAVGLALVGGGVWAAVSFLATGPQPAEALPSSTLGYASLDLDPSGGQKIEAFRMIQKFPALKKELGGLNADDDLLEKAFAEVEQECDGFDYADDVKPWIGQRFAAAAVDLGKDQPTPVGVLQVSDADAAGDGLAKLQKCAGNDIGGWAVDGDWAVVAESKALADQVVEATAEGSLADDETFRQWTGDAGDAGVASFYAAPAAGAYLGDALSFPMNPLAGPMGLLGGSSMQCELGVDGPVCEGSKVDTQAPDVPEDVQQALADFQGAAATLRFDEGSLELEYAGDPGIKGLDAFAGGDAAAAVGSLPENTAAAIGVGLPDGWFQHVLDQVESLSGGSMTGDEVLAEMKAETGLTGDDIETLFGDSTALAVSSDIDPATVFGSSDGSGLPIGVKIKGDADGIGAVLDKIGAQAGSDATFLGHDADGDFVAVGPDGSYRKALLEDGNLGGSAVFENVVREADDAGAIFFVNFDAGDWLSRLAQTDPEAKQNLEPLQGLGFSSWAEDGTAHAVFRLTTD